MLRALSRPIRTVLQWQLIATAGMALAAAWFEGMHGAVSAAAGGLVSICAGLTAAWMASRSRAKWAGGVLVGALTAEAVKIVLAILLLWLVLMSYGEVVVEALILSFIVTMLIFAMAFFVREY